MTQFIYTGGDPNESTSYGTGYTSQTYNFHRYVAATVTNEEDIELLKADENLAEVPGAEITGE